MSDEDERLAGSIILKDLALFNKAAILFEQKIIPTINTAVAELVQDWLRKRDWTGEPDFDDIPFWVCPSKWKEESVEPIARFYFCTRPGVESWSYRVADMCGIGETDWGFKFEVTYSWFGGKNAWAASARNMGGLADELVKKGWANLGKGVFFRQVKLPAELLSEAWESAEWSTVLAPLEQALDALVSDQAIFDNIIAAGNSKTK